MAHSSLSETSVFMFVGPQTYTMVATMVRLRRSFPEANRNSTPTSAVMASLMVQLRAALYTYLTWLFVKVSGVSLQLGDLLAGLCQDMAMRQPTNWQQGSAEFFAAGFLHQHVQQPL